MSCLRLAARSRPRASPCPLDDRSEEFREIRLVVPGRVACQLLELVANTYDRLLKLEYPRQVDRRCRQDEVRGHGVQRRLELVHLALAVSHRRQQMLERRVAGERRRQLADGDGI